MSGPSAVAVSISVVACAALLALICYGGWRVAYDNNIKQRQRVEACLSIENEQTRALCIVSTGQDDR